MSLTSLGLSESSTDIKSGPWWIKTLWVAGPITIIAMALVYLISVEFRSDLKIVKENLTQHQDRSEQLYEIIEDYIRVQTLLTRELCVNSSGQAGSDPSRCFRE